MMIGFLCTRLKMDKETKEDMIFCYSNGRSSSTKDLFESEATQLIQFLVNESGLPQYDSFKMKRKILSMAHEMNWEVSGGKVDLGRINNWCIRFSGKNKVLDAFSYAELPALVTQFEMVYRDYLKGI